MDSNAENLTIVLAITTVISITKIENINKNIGNGIDTDNYIDKFLHFKATNGTASTSETCECSTQSHFSHEGGRHIFIETISNNFTFSNISCVLLFMYSFF